MRKIFFFILFCLTNICFLLSAQGIKVSLNYTRYATDKLEPYIEFRFIVDGQSVTYSKNNEGVYEANVEILVEAIKLDSVFGSIHYILSSDQYLDTAIFNKSNFADIVNLPLPNGDYILKFLLIDMNNIENNVEFQDMITINFSADSVCTSPVLLLQSFSKAKEGDFYVKYGYSIPPLFYNYLDDSLAFLPFYTEIYNTDRFFGKNKIFKVACYVVNAATKKIAMPDLNYKITYKSAPLLLVSRTFNLSKLPSGNYYVVVEILDSSDKFILSQDVFFQRNNPAILLNENDFINIDYKGTFVDNITDIKVLQDYVACLFPISNSLEKDFYDKRMKKMPEDKLKSFFYSFWEKRSPDNPEKGWLTYKKQVDHVNKIYGNKITKGYRTDRGRVFLQYGPPNDIRESAIDPKAHPYEIWHYNFLGGQSQVKFVFYCDEGVSVDYRLVHSTLNGELSNPAWQRDIIMGHEPVQDWYIRQPENYWGNNMDKNWGNR